MIEVTIGLQSNSASLASTELLIEMNVLVNLCEMEST